VTNTNSGTVSVLDTSANTVVAYFADGVFGYPFGVSVTPDGKRLYVANQDTNNVSVIDTATYAVLGIISVGSLPQAYGQFIGPASSPALTPAPSSFLLAGVGIVLLGLYWMRDGRRKYRA
jgi:YVTN family beta-propeller protein